MFRKPSALIGLSVLFFPLAMLSVAETDKRAPKNREFRLIYAATITRLKPGQTARVWLPVPPSNSEQTVEIVARKLPGKHKLTTEPKFGNRLLYVEAQADPHGEIPLSITYRIRRWEIKGDAKTTTVSKKELEEFLQPDAHVPVGGKPAEKLLKGRTLPDDQMRLAKELYDLVNSHMTYSKKGTGWGRGDAEWACDSRYGNCTDFHSLFISLARTEKLPAKFVIGFALPARQGRGELPGYHCWAWFHPMGRGWLPVDISQANLSREKAPAMVSYCFGNLTEDRVAFSTGRDLELVPRQAGSPLNFFIYPYVEVEGRPWPDAKVQRRFRYEDVDGH
jgi:transglutaminase-like putative cysteine protease